MTIFMKKETFSAFMISRLFLFFFSHENYFFFFMLEGRWRFAKYENADAQQQSRKGRDL